MDGMDKAATPQRDTGQQDGPRWSILEGDCREQLASLDAGSVQTCVTSPPYFGLRDYGHDGQIGLEPSPDEFVTALVAVFREVRRVLRDDATVWLNLGDSYNAYNGNRGPAAGLNAVADGQRNAPDRGLTWDGAKPKDLLGIPWRVAFALQADGWYLRSDIIWAKPNPMPESVTDRPTKAHEYLFLLSKQARYFYDHEAIREASEHVYAIGPETDGYSEASGRNDGTPHRAGIGFGVGPDGRNRRSVWTVATQPYPGAHFATFPPKLIEPCILAGTSPKACGVCGAPWTRVTEADEFQRGDERTHGGTAWITNPTGKVPGSNTRGVPDRNHRTVGWEPFCDHQGDTGSCVVLDPFSGAGTTGMVALRHGRSYVGVELNPDYVRLSRDRIIADSPLLNTHAEVAA